MINSTGVLNTLTSMST